MGLECQKQKPLTLTDQDARSNNKGRKNYKISYQSFIKKKYAYLLNEKQNQKLIKIVEEEIDNLSRRKKFLFQSIDFFVSKGVLSSMVFFDDLVEMEEREMMFKKCEYLGDSILKTEMVKYVFNSHPSINDNSHNNIISSENDKWSINSHDIPMINKLVTNLYLTIIFEVLELSKIFCNPFFKKKFKKIPKIKANVMEAILGELELKLCDEFTDSFPNNDLNMNEELKDTGMIVTPTMKKNSVREFVREFVKFIGDCGSILYSKMILDNKHESLTTKNVVNVIIEVLSEKGVELSHIKIAKILEEKGIKINAKNVLSIVRQRNNIFRTKRSKKVKGKKKGKKNRKQEGSKLCYSISLREWDVESDDVINCIGGYLELKNKFEVTKITKTRLELAIRIIRKEGAMSVKRLVKILRMKGDEIWLKDDWVKLKKVQKVLERIRSMKINRCYLGWIRFLRCFPFFFELKKSRKRKKERIIWLLEPKFSIYHYFGIPHLSFNLPPRKVIKFQEFSSNGIQNIELEDIDMNNLDELNYYSARKEEKNTTKSPKHIEDINFQINNNKQLQKDDISHDRSNSINKRNLLPQKSPFKKPFHVKHKTIEIVKPQTNFIIKNEFDCKEYFDDTIFSKNKENYSLFENDEITSKLIGKKRKRRESENESESSSISDDSSDDEMIPKSQRRKFE